MTAWGKAGILFATIIMLPVLAGGGSGLPVPAVASARVASATSPCNGYGIPGISQQPTLPQAFQPIGQQIGADCFAWQGFIALNWRASSSDSGSPDPAADWSVFGAPGDQASKVWQSFYDATTVFGRPLGTKALWTGARSLFLKLQQVSKLGDANLTLEGFSQAGDHKWLTSQRRSLTYYSILINEDEFDFITKNVFSGNDLTTFAGQAACAGQPGIRGPTGAVQGGFVLPKGSDDTDCLGNTAVYGRNVGAIEIKAAWTELPADGTLNARYLNTRAQITDPFGRTHMAVVGLVGLHIIRRVPGGEQFVWSTFEHIDNSPDQSSNAAGYADPALPRSDYTRPGYTYFDPGCSSVGDPAYGCGHNKLPGTACGASGGPPGCDPLASPMQVTRWTPVDSVANSVTGYVWSILPKNSVFGYYRLVNVQWPQNGTNIQPGSTVPLSRGGITPTMNVANTTLETYLQNDPASNNCMSCHQNASIGSPRAVRRTTLAGISRRMVLPPPVASPTKPGSLRGTSTPAYASSYSFLFAAETRR